MLGLKSDKSRDYSGFSTGIDDDFKKKEKEMDDKIAYLQSKIAIARTHLETHPDQDDHDVRHALGALEIDDPKWRERIYDPEIVADQRKLIENLHAEIKSKDDLIASLQKRIEKLGYYPEITPNGNPVKDDTIKKPIEAAVKHACNNVERVVKGEVESLVDRPVPGNAMQDEQVQNIIAVIEKTELDLHVNEKLALACAIMMGKNASDKIAKIRELVEERGNPVAGGQSQSLIEKRASEIVARIKELLKKDGK
jgi:hypothetical protein